MKTLLLVLLVTGLTFNASAASKKSHPCGEVMKACTDAGYTKKGHKEGKGLHEDCMKPLTSGQTVAGVTVEAEKLEACKKVAEKRKAKRTEVQAEAKEKRIESHEGSAK